MTRNEARLARRVAEKHKPRAKALRNNGRGGITGHRANSNAHGLGSPDQSGNAMGRAFHAKKRPQEVTS